MCSKAGEAYEAHPDENKGYLFRARETATNTRTWQRVKGRHESGRLHSWKGGGERLQVCSDWGLLTRKSCRQAKQKKELSRGRVSSVVAVAVGSIVLGFFWLSLSWKEIGKELESCWALTKSEPLCWQPGMLVWLLRLWLQPVGLTSMPYVVWPLSTHQFLESLIRK